MFNVCFVLRHRQASLHIQYCLGVHIEWIVFVHLFTQTLGFINYKNKCMYYFMLRYSHTVATFSYFYPPSLLHLHLFWLIFEIVILTFTHSDLPVLHYPVVFREHCGRQMAAVITEDNVYSEAEVNGAPPVGGDDQVQLPGPEGNIQGQVASTKASASTQHVG